jgi:hypothetical protein
MRRGRQDAEPGGHAECLCTIAQLLEVAEGANRFVGSQVDRDVATDAGERIDQCRRQAGRGNASHVDDAQRPVRGARRDAGRRYFLPQRTVPHDLDGVATGDLAQHRRASLVGRNAKLCAASHPSARSRPDPGRQGRVFPNGNVVLVIHHRKPKRAGDDPAWSRARVEHIHPVRSPTQHRCHGPRQEHDVACRAAQRTRSAALNADVEARMLEVPEGESVLRRDSQDADRGPRCSETGCGSPNGGIRGGVRMLNEQDSRTTHTTALWSDCRRRDPTTRS